MGFVYFASGINTITPANAQSIGLGYLFDANAPTPPLTCVQCTSGPDGQSGVVLALGESLPTISTTDHQWTRMSETCWIRFDGEYSPEGLARGRQLAGRRVTLADGREWLIPCAVCPASAERVRLPQTLALNAEGEWIYGQVLQPYVEFWNAAERALANMLEAKLTIGDELDLVVAAVQINYRVSKWELAACGALAVHHDSLREALATIIDLSALEDIAKKNGVSE